MNAVADAIPDWLAGLGSQSVNPFASAEIISVNTDPAKYHQQDAKRGDPDYVMSRSDLIEFSRCPHRWVSGHCDEEETKSMGWGSLLDCLLFTPDKFKSSFVVRPATYTDDKGNEKPWHHASNVCKAWIKKHEGMAVVTPDDALESERAISILRADNLVAELLKNGDPQVYVLSAFNDSMTGVSVKVRALIDLVPALPCPALLDLKTAHDASGDGWAKKVFSQGYYVQAALYLDSYNLAVGDNRSAFFHLVQENFAPYEMAKWCLTSQFIELGRSRYVKALQEYCQCLHSGKWPGYSIENGLQIEGFGIVEPRPWMVMAE